jgi:O-acetyl-ADP-ribose deacetylase (regulator of RNase III)
LGLQTYSQLIDECLKQAGAAGFTSVHFPSFGCGNLSWPPEEMAGMLQAAARVHPRIHVKVLCKNEETLGRMTHSLRSAGAESALSKPKHNITVVHANIVDIQVLMNIML